MKVRLDIIEYIILSPVLKAGTEVDIPPYLLSNFNTAFTNLERASKLLEQYYWVAQGGKKEEVVATRGVLVKVPPPSTEVKTK